MEGRISNAGLTVAPRPMPPSNFSTETVSGNTDKSAHGPFARIGVAELNTAGSFGVDVINRSRF